MGLGEKNHQGYWAVIPAPILNDKTLPVPAKFLYPVIASLTEQTGYCWASNEYLAKWFDVSERTVSRWVKALEKRGFIRCEMSPTDKGHGRRIYAGIFIGGSKNGGVDKSVETPGGVDKSVEGGVDKSVETYIRNDNKSNDIPPKAPQCAPERFDGLWQYYPKEGRKNKQRAIKAWDKLHPDTELIDRIAFAVKKLKASEQWRKGVGIPYLSTFLNNLDDNLENAEMLDASEEGGQAHTVRSSLPPL